VANPPATTVTVEPVRESKVGRLVGHIPGLRRLEKKNQNFVPARPIREIAPATPASEQLEHDVPVDLRVRIDPSGRVASIEPASKAGNPRLADLAADAARNWQFEPARRNDEQVSSELILHFTFRSTVRSAP
jgi:TonB family protein